MAINDDECDFDTLSALLENDEALESRKPLGISSLYYVEFTSLC